MKKVSIIIPCYNVERWIDRCMTSIAVQTMGIDDLEIICIDDASTDGTWEHLQKWEQIFPENLLLIRLEENRRQGAARNIGLQYASAEWISFVDADDWLEPDYFEQMYTPVEKHGYDVVVCNKILDHAETLAYLKKEECDAGRKQHIHADTVERKKELFLTRSMGLTACAKLVRKGFLLEHQIFFPEGLAYEDNYWITFLYLYADDIYVTGKNLYHWFMHGQSTIHGRNEPYHMDRITIQMMKWEELGRRGFLEAYRGELEYDLLYYGICFMKTLVFRYDQPPFSYYQLERQVICERVPEHIMGLYTDCFSGFEGILFNALTRSLDKAGFQAFIERVRKFAADVERQEQNQIGTGNSRLRIVMFYSQTESFNFFTDRLAEELQKRGHEICICDLEDQKDETEHSYRNLNQFLSEKVDVVICFDGLGTREDQFIEQWNRHQAVVIDILMDPPFRFHPTLEKHPEKYLLFCCDLEHVEYVKKYFQKEVAEVAFMPHVGVLPQKDSPVIPFRERKYDILFSGSYVRPESYLEKIQGLFPNAPDICRLYQYVYDTLLKDSSLTIEAAVLNTLKKMEYSVSDTMLKTLLNRSLYIDWAIRMHHRGRVISSLAGAGLELYLLGEGWEAHPSVEYTNVHRIEGQVPYVRTLACMADAKINLNVMPWFKAGTHDRIFNSLLQHSLPLTDPSIWITENFKDGLDIALYDLDHLEKLPDIVWKLLDDSTGTEEMIRRGYEKVSREFTWSNCTDWILEAVDRADNIEKVKNLEAV